MGDCPKNKSFHYGKKNAKHDLRGKKKSLSKRNDLMSIYKPKTKGHSLVLARLTVASGGSGGWEASWKQSQGP